ncbi:MAG: thymidylate synthase [Methanomicrobiales archaeon]|jgi:thymidylate synthase|nr:thymidylate synthase [Methanomicrobiales archaeon]
MILITAKTIGEAHEQVVQLIYNKCSKEESSIRITEDGERTYEPWTPICIHVQEPFAEPMRASASFFGDRFLQAYQSTLYTIAKRRNDGTDAVYTYGNRLRDYPRAIISATDQSKQPLKRAKPGIIEQMMTRFGYQKIEKEDGETDDLLSYAGDGNGGGIDQIKRSIINRLVENPESRRAVAITWVPYLDIESAEPPCLQIVQALIDAHNAIHLVCLFRSNDMLSAWGQNAYGLAHLLQFICNEINKERKRQHQPLLTVGWIETISVSAHMYFTRDDYELRRYLDLKNV